MFLCQDCHAGCGCATFLTSYGPCEGGCEIRTRTVDCQQHHVEARRAREATAARLREEAARRAVPCDPEITVTVPVRAILDRGCWDAVCELRGINPWAVNEGLLSTSDTITFTETEARRVGLLREDR